jgi:ubiquinone/menaquinone biosynthesis C-methylase UbiE
LKHPAPDPKSEVLFAYDLRSASYDLGGNPLIAVEEMVVLSLLRNLQFRDCLDAACGTGRYALRLAAEGRNVIGVDASDGMLEVARRKAAEKRLVVDFRCDDVCALSVESETVDLVICALALAHVENLTSACASLARVLRPGGHMIISDAHPDIQAEWGPNNKIPFEGRLLSYPAYHAHVADYEQAVKHAGCALIASIDVPMQQTQRGLATGALVVLARKAA